MSAPTHQGKLGAPLGRGLLLALALVPALCQAFCLPSPALTHHEAPAVEEHGCHGGTMATEASLWQFFEPVLSRRLPELEAQSPIQERVRAALFELLPRGQNQLGQVAKRLATSSRSLQRRLAQEGTTFRKVLEETRAQLATHYLKQSELTAAEIAFLLGYDDPNSFFPAFRAWTGITPEALRAASLRT